MTIEGKDGSVTAAINVTPMIDVLLVLLIIFMVIVPTVSRGDLAQTPRPSSRVTQDLDAVVLEVLQGVDGQASFRINQQEVSRDTLAEKLSSIYANRAQKVLFVKGDDQLSFTEVAQIIDMSHSAGIDHVGLITPAAHFGQ